MVDLKRRAESLCEKSLGEDQKLEVEQTARDAEEQWRTVLGAAEDAQRCCEAFVTFANFLSKLGRSWLTVGPSFPLPCQAADGCLGAHAVVPGPAGAG